MRNANAQRTGQSPAAGPSLGETAWRVVQPGSVPHFAASSSGDIVLGPTFNENWWSEEVFTSSYRSDSSFGWRRKLPAYQWGASQGLLSSPALDPQGNLITTAGQGQLIKFSPDLATQLWSFPGNTNTINDVSPIVAADGSIRWAQAQIFRGISPSGAVLFSTASSVVSVAISPTGDMAGVHGPVDQSNNGPRVTYFNADGTVRWTKIGLGGGNGTNPVFGPDGTLYVSPKGGMIAYNPDGTTKWSDPSPIAARGPALGANGQLYSLGTNAVRAYNKDSGAVLWTTTLPGSPKENIAIDVAGTLYVTTDTGNVAALSPAGAILWQAHICDSFTTGPIIGPDRLLIAAGKVGFEKFVFAIR